MTIFSRTGLSLHEREGRLNIRRMREVLTIAELEDELSLPTEGVLEALASLDGDLMVLGAGGKMGPTLARMARRAMDQLGQLGRRVIAVSRFANERDVSDLLRHGVEVVRCDLLDREAVAALPEVPNVIMMAGQKFGTGAAPEMTWVMNTLVPAVVMERFRRSRMVVFSTGCVYPLSKVSGGGSREEDTLGPPGEYANSCVGRERISEYYSRRNESPMLLLRLSYAIELRYGVLMDVAQKIMRGEPVDVTMGYVNVIWQGDANARAIQSLGRVSSPPVALNVTGLERVAIRDLARVLGRRLGRRVETVGEEAEVAWLFDASRSYEWFGPPTVSLDEMIEATVMWVLAGGATLGKPTHFEVRDGSF